MSTMAIRMRARRRGGRLRPAWRQPLAVVGAVIAIAWIVIAIFTPLIAPHDPLAQTFAPQQSPSAKHLFGTDELGRDVLSRVIHGSRVSLPIALVLVGLAAVIGSTTGAIAGYFRGVADGAQYFQWWWIGTFPGLAIFTAVLAFNFLGDSLRDAFDPQTAWGGEAQE